MSNIEKLSFYDLDMQKPDLQGVLKRIDPLTLQNKISKFRKQNISRMSDMEINQAILDVLCSDGVFSYYTNMRVYPAGTKFYRVKRFSDSKIPNSRFSYVQDYWETDPKFLKEYGRLNKPMESLLYTSPDLFCSIKEVHIGDGDYFAAIQYTAKRPVKVNMIGGDYDYTQLGVTDERAILIHEMLNGFLRDEFSRDVGKGTEYLYRVSERIAKDYFDLPPKIVQDAWAYSSVQDKTKYNVCFRPEIAHDILELNGAMICKLGTEKAIRVFCVAIGSDVEGKISFYPLGSDEQKRVFPDITKE